jgi:phospho-N-acetylmuramoyl-pentapeptide-transferase
MIYLLLKSYINEYHIANLFHYISFRAILSILFSFLFCLIFGNKIITILRSWKEGGQPIRDLGPESHKAKAGTPTMGGVMIIISVLISSFLFSDLSNPYVYLFLWVLLGFGALGFADDYLKVVKKNHKGVSAKMKLLVQFLVSVPACVIVTYLAPENYSTVLTFPFFKNIIINLGWLYVPFAAFIVIGSSNAVNLTDGLDGLAIVPISIVAACYGLILYLVGNVVYSGYLQLIYIPKSAELCVLCAALIGGGIGFLWFNAQPAQIFMGDTGSLSMGGVLGILSVISKHEILLAIAGGLFVIETLSVIIQVYYFKFTGGKRFFLMAPIHHHFEKAGWSESKVVIRFWIISLVFALIALTSLKLR